MEQILVSAFDPKDFIYGSLEAIQGIVKTIMVKYDQPTTKLWFTRLLASDNLGSIPFDVTAIWGTLEAAKRQITEGVGDDQGGIRVGA